MIFSQEKEKINKTEPARLLCPWNSPSKNAGVNSQSLLQGISSFLLLILRIDWLSLLFLKTEASRRNGDNK